GPQPIDARKTRLSNIVQETGAKTIHYLYDFGDSWDHVIKLEKWFDNTTTEGLPFLLEAAGRCPPEDAGGAPGYAQYLDAISDATHPEHEHMRLWGPEQFDPNVVDRKALEAAVNALSDIWKPRRHTTRSK
ncbi:pRiA4b ORF-3-like protein, partial [Bradyrhizobium shewense]